MGKTQNLLENDRVNWKYIGMPQTKDNAKIKVMIKPHFNN